MVTTEALEPDRVARLCEQLTHASSIDEIMEVRERIETTRFQVKDARLGLDVENEAAMARILTLRKLGKTLRALQLRGGDRRTPARENRTLASFGLERNLSSRAQRLAEIANDDVSVYFQQMTESGKAISVAGLVKFSRARRRARLEASMYGGAR